MSDIQIDDANENDEAFADFVLGMILHANGGEITISAEHAKSYSQVKRVQGLTFRRNLDSSFTIRLEDCPHLNKETTP